MASDIDYLLEGDPREVITWRRKTDVWGDPVRGSRAMIAQLEMTHQLAIEKFGPSSGVEVFQGAFNTDIVQSAGTHDEDRCLDGFLAGRIDLADMLRFFRGLGQWEGWMRTVAQGFSLHFHLIASHTYDTPVGEFVPRQRTDYRGNPPRNGLADHSVDTSWHPNPIPRFNYSQWKDDHMPLTDAEVNAIADKAVTKLLATDLVLTDGTTVDVRQALRRSAQYAARFDALDTAVAGILSAVAAVKSRINSARTAIMAGIDHLDDQVGP